MSPDAAAGASRDVLDRFRLDGRVVVVTGASSGLGAEFARACAQAGADVVIAARRVDRLAETADAVRAVGGSALVVQTDVADPEQCQALIDAAMAKHGRVDGLVNTAGVAAAHPATRETPEQFRSVLDINLHGTYWMAQAAGRVMRPGSSIVNVSSMLGLTTAGLPQAAYASSKAAVIGLTRDLAAQWTGRKGIRVNAIAPGYFTSEMSDLYPEGHMDDAGRRIIMGRTGDPAELSPTLILLLSDASSYTTGQTLVVDGGVTIN